MPQIAAAGLLAAEIKNVLAVWRTPERLSAGVAWRHPNARLTDMLVFGETAVVGSRRAADGLPVPLRAFAVTARCGTMQPFGFCELPRRSNRTGSIDGATLPSLHPD